MSRSPGVRLSLAAVALSLLLALAYVESARASRDEYEVKAAFLLNFARLVQWPASARPAEQEPLVVSVLGSDAALRAITRSVGDTRIGAHRVSVRRISDAEELPGSHIVFVGRGADGLDEVLAEARKHAVLAVGESRGFARRGGVINFFTEDNKLRFEVNPEAARNAGLEISARLLRLAVLVGDEG